MARTMTLGTESTQVLVVDARPQDYFPLVAKGTTGGPGFQFATTSSDALKLRRAAGRSIWLINIHLPDGSGCELAKAIRARDPHSVVYLVGDAYDAAEEVAALMTGGTMYVCKPVDRNWLPLSRPTHADGKFPCSAQIALRRQLCTAVS